MQQINQRSVEWQKRTVGTLLDCGLWALTETVFIRMLDSKSESMVSKKLHLRYLSLKCVITCKNYRFFLNEKWYNEIKLKLINNDEIIKFLKFKVLHYIQINYLNENVFPTVEFLDSLEQSWKKSGLFRRIRITHISDQNLEEIWCRGANGRTELHQHSSPIPPGRCQSQLF